jgi:HEAT repeat protein
MNAATALKLMGDPSTVPELIHALSDDDAVSLQAALALAAMGRNEGLQRLIKSLKVTGPPSDDWKIEVIDALLKLRDPGILKALQELVQERTSPELRHKAMDAIEKLKRRDATL